MKERRNYDVTMLTTRDILKCTELPKLEHITYRTAVRRTTEWMRKQGLEKCKLSKWHRQHPVESYMIKL